MKAIEVTTVFHRKEFADFPRRLYRGDPNWVCPLDNEAEAVFNPARNIAFRHGEAIRWLLVDENNKTIGRVAAFIDEIRSRANRQPTGGFGFFEVIDSLEAAFMLFDTARKWLSDRGMEAMDGPINFGENDNYWGLLVEGFTQPGFGMPYNKQYYRRFFEEYGFMIYFEQYSYHKDLASNEILPERFMKIAKWVSRKPGYSFRHFKYSQRDKFIADMVDIYNAAWAVFKEDFTPLDPVMLRNTLKQTRAFIDEELIWYAYHNEKPVAIFVIFPDLNQIIKHFNGKLSPWNMIRFVWFRFTHKMTRVRALVAGVHPSFQNSGIESAIFLQLSNVFRRKGFYRELELSWVGDFNPKMISIYKALGASKAKTHITFRYMINDSLPFKMYRLEMAENMAERQARHKT